MRVTAERVIVRRTERQLLPISERNIPTGTLVFWGKAARPMPGYLSRCIAKVVSSVPGIVEAHLPQCLVSLPNEKPDQVLVLVLRHGVEKADVLSAVTEGLDAFFREDQHLDILTVSPESTLVETLRGARSRIFSSM